MATQPLNQSRFVVGLILVATAVLLMLLTDGVYSTAGLVALVVLGLVTLAIARQ